MTTQIQKRDASVTRGSIFDVAARTGDKPELVMADAEVIVLLDTSASMSTPMGGGKTRFDFAKEALADVQRRYEGKVMVVSFHNWPTMCYGGVPSEPSGGTEIGKALEFVKPFDGTKMRFVLISDGEPTDGDAAIHIAATFHDPIDTIFIGNDGDSGLEFLKRLATGRSLGRVDVQQLGSRIVALLGNGD